LLILDLSGNVETSLNIAKLDTCSGDTRKTFDIMPFNNWSFDSFEFGVDDRLFELFECFSVLSLGLCLYGESLADERLLLRSDIFGQGTGNEPVLDVASHVQGVQWL
jgi:hypothetical protein